MEKSIGWFMPSVMTCNQVTIEFDPFHQIHFRFITMLYGWRRDSFPPDFVGSTEEDTKSLYNLSKDLESQE
jgi:hypothetical protein